MDPHREDHLASPPCAPLRSREYFFTSSGTKKEPGTWPGSPNARDKSRLRRSSYALWLLVAAFAFLSARFSFRDLAAAVLLLLFLGDLSAIGHSLSRKHGRLRLVLTLRHPSRECIPDDASRIRIVLTRLRLTASAGLLLLDAHPWRRTLQPHGIAEAQGRKLVQG